MKILIFLKFKRLPEPLLDPKSPFIMSRKFPAYWKANMATILSINIHLQTFIEKFWTELFYPHHETSSPNSTLTEVSPISILIPKCLSISSIEYL